MKKIFILLFLVVLSCQIKVYSQGSTRTPEDTTNWDLPAGYTSHYGLYVFKLLTNPGGRINLNTEHIDSLLYSLIVYTDTAQMIIRNDTLVLSNNMSGTHAFTTTAGSDSVAISGMDSLDVIIVTPLSAAYNVNDILSVDEHTGYFKVYRNSSGGTSGLTYNYVWIKKH